MEVDSLIHVYTELENRNIVLIDFPAKIDEKQAAITLDLKNKCEKEGLTIEFVGNCLVIDPMYRQR